MRQRCGSCGEETFCTAYGVSWVCGRASCLLAAMRRHLSL